MIFTTAGDYTEYPYTPLESVRETIRLNNHKHITRKNELRFSNYTFESWQRRYVGNHTLSLKQDTHGFTVCDSSKSEPLEFDPKHSFYVSKKYILQNPLTQYRSLLASVTKNDGKCEESVYMSFCWGLLLS